MDDFETISRLAIERGMASPAQIEACRDTVRRAAGQPRGADASAVSILLDCRVLTARQLERLRADTAIVTPPAVPSPVRGVPVVPRVENASAVVLPSMAIPDLSLGGPATRSVAGPPARSGRPPAGAGPVRPADGPPTTRGSARARHPDDVLDGRTLGGKYHILRKLGQGGMGAVFLARQTNLGREVAIKMLPPELSESPEILERFAREARLSAQLSHPNVVQVHDVESDPATGLQYLVMERIDGESLAERMKRDGPLPWRDAVGLAIQAARGLGAAHKAGVIHRDVKPANLMLARDGTLKVTDFGLSRAFEGDGHLSRTGQILGTPHFMSPEQARGEKDLDARADVFSLGATLYCLLAGHPPFRGGSATVIIYNVIYESPEPLTDTRSDLPMSVQRCVFRAISKARDERPLGMAELGAELERLIDNTGLRGRVRDLASSVMAPNAGGFAARGNRRRAIFLGAALALVVALVGYAAWPSGPPEGPGLGSGSGSASGSEGAESPRTNSPPVVAKPPFLEKLPPFLEKPPVLPTGPPFAEIAAEIDRRMWAHETPTSILTYWLGLSALAPRAASHADEIELESALYRFQFISICHTHLGLTEQLGSASAAWLPRAVVVTGLGRAAARSVAGTVEDIATDMAVLALFERGLPLGIDAQLAFGLHPDLERVRTATGAWVHGIADVPGASPSLAVWGHGGRAEVSLPAAAVAARTRGLSAAEWRARLAAAPTEGTLVELARRALAAALIGDPQSGALAAQLAHRRAQVRASETSLAGEVELDVDSDRVRVTGWQAVALRALHDLAVPKGETATAIARAIVARGNRLLEDRERAKWGQWLADRLTQFDGKEFRGPPR